MFYPTIIPSWRKVTQGERQRTERKRKQIGAVPSSVQVGLSKLAILSYANLLTSQLERGGENNA